MGNGTSAYQDIEQRDLRPEPGAVEGGSSGQAAEEEERMPGLGKVLAETLNHFFPAWKHWVEELRDIRNQIYIIYPARFLVMMGVLLFMLKLKARRRIKFEFCT